jgi:hypothetical protein
MTSSDIGDSGIYSSNFTTLLNEYINPVCPDSVVGSPQVYNTQTRQCTSIPASALAHTGPTAAACGGAPFQVQANGQCYSTNSCSTTPSLTKSCMNTQNVPYEKQPLSGPGVLANMRY